MLMRKKKKKKKKKTLKICVFNFLNIIKSELYVYIYFICSFLNVVLAQNSQK
jgi:hypothetical protein